jgi:hypothetical protein
MDDRARHLRAGAAALLLLFAASAAIAGHPSALPLPDVQLLQPGRVTHLASQPDGGLLVGGYFLDVGGVEQSRELARLRPDGSADPDWAPTYVQGLVTLATGMDGSAYLTARSISQGGVTRQGVARLSPDGTMDPDWGNHLGFGSPVLLAAGDWIYDGIRRISAATGEYDPQWRSDLHGGVQAMALHDGLLYVGGCVWPEEGGVIGSLERIVVATARVDPAWTVTLDSCVMQVAVGTDGSVYATGYFSTANGQPRNGIARFSAASGALDAWNPAPDAPPLALAVEGGAVFIGGDFTYAGGAARAGLARLSPLTAQADANWNPAPSGDVGVLLASAGRMWVGGGFNGISGSPRLALASLDPHTGEAAATADVASAGTVRALVRDAEGGLIIGGRFDRADGAIRQGLARLDATGHFDPEWAPPIAGTISALAVDARGDLHVGGEFGSASGARNLVRIPAGSDVPDASWMPNPDGGVQVLVANADALYVGGDFASIGGEASGGLVRFLSGQMQPDPSWTPVPDGAVSAIAVGASGTVFAGGCFGTIGGQPRRGLAALDANSSVALPGWVADVDADPYGYTGGCVDALVLDGAGALYVGGSFDALATRARYGLGRVDAASGIAHEWNPTDGGWQPTVRALALEGGSVLVGGNLLSGGNSRAGVVRVSAGTGDMERQWDAHFSDDDARVLLLDADGESPRGNLLVGGTFDHVGADWEDGGSHPRYGLVALSLDVIFADGFTD